MVGMLIVLILVINNIPAATAISSVTDIWQIPIFHIEPLKTTILFRELYICDFDRIAL